MPVPPLGSFSVPVCKNCGAILIHPGSFAESCPNDSDPKGNHVIEYRTAHLDPPGLRY